jgi:2-(1,2-epoxy-1,2-dihydrophenyl)acetyl-CoA isomerase
VLLTSAGKDFCSGMDLVAANKPRDPDAPRPRTGHLQRSLPQGAHGLIRAMAEAQVPIVAGVRGWAAGFGCPLALNADVVLVTPETKFWVPFVGRGFTPDSGSTWLLPRLVGLARAKEMILRSRPVDGRQAEAWGLVAHCVEEGDFDAELEALVEELGSSATVSVGLARRLLEHNLTVSLSEAMENETLAVEVSTRSDDFKEGIRAFRSKESPRFTGR